MSDHHHHHHHGVQNYNKAFALGIMLNSVFVGIEVAYGLSSSSLALLADAGHNLSDIFSLILAWGASLLSKKSASEKRTYGYRKITIIASNISAILLLMTLGGICLVPKLQLGNAYPQALLDVSIQQNNRY